jgi:hypothetical protein
VTVALDGDLGDELAHPAAGQAEPLGHGPLAQRLPGGDRRRVGGADRLLHIARTCGTAGPMVAARGPRARLTCCMAISTAPVNATAGQAEISAPSSPYPVPKAMFAPIVALMPS